MRHWAAKYGKHFVAHFMRKIMLLLWLFGFRAPCSAYIFMAFHILLPLAGSLRPAPPRLLFRQRFMMRGKFSPGAADAFCFL